MLRLNEFPFPFPQHFPHESLPFLVIEKEAAGTMRSARSKSRNPFGDGKPLGVLESTVEFVHPVNAPSGERMGHASYVHPQSGVLYVVGGSDVAELPQALLLSPRERTVPPIPFVEVWDAETRAWRTSNEALPPSCDVSGMEDGECSDCAPVEGEVEAPVTVRECSPIDFPKQLPDGFSWPTLSALGIFWKARQESSAAGATENPITIPEEVASGNGSHKINIGRTKDTTSVEPIAENTVPSFTKHPTVLLVGGWKEARHVQRSRCIDLEDASVVRVKGSTPSSAHGLACSTVTIVDDHAYVFGGNTAKSCTSTLDVLDLTTFMWMAKESPGREDVNNRPLPRSSHVAGLLLDRYIVVYGGRNLQMSSKTVAGKNKKPMKKLDPKSAITVTPMSFDFCNDVAVYSVEAGRWVAPCINVGPSGPAPRYGHAACVLSSKELLIHGGIGAGGKVLSDAWILQLSESPSNVLVSWVKVRPRDTNENQLPTRCLHSMALGADRCVYLTGGLSSSERVEDVCVLRIKPLSEILPDQPESRKRGGSGRDGKLYGSRGK
uniref:Uncharacterized protein n=1 Tax=Trypanosoma vivax (strain Y486) TaxID=1055687 RepID=G0U8M2_TRYVY|nr:conserved hypothetical protein [Trypanosoma vivax Y486]